MQPTRLHLGALTNQGWWQVAPLGDLNLLPGLLGQLPILVHRVWQQVLRKITSTSGRTRRHVLRRRADRARKLTLQRLEELRRHIGQRAASALPLGLALE